MFDTKTDTKNKINRATATHRDN